MMSRDLLKREGEALSKRVHALVRDVDRFEFELRSWPEALSAKRAELERLRERRDVVWRCFL